jgi:hypothetical protein
MTRETGSCADSAPLARPMVLLVEEDDAEGIRRARPYSRASPDLFAPLA